MTTDVRFTEIDDLMPAAAALREIRHHIHHHPELAYEEHETAALVAHKLEQWGWQVTRGVGGTGVVGTLRVGDGARSIGIRADMDALPIVEATGLPYASGTHGKMHACGHDGHTTMLLGAAQQLAKTRNFRGTVHLYFQPAEEHGVDSGAKKMIDDGLFERFPCDAVFGMHNHPGAAPGVFLTRRGPFMSAGDKAIIKIEGVGGHAARPHLTVDPVVVAASIVMALQTIVARNVDPSQPAVVTVGSMHAGTANNVIPSGARLELSVRSFSPDVRALLKRRIVELAETQAASYGATADVEYIEGYPVVVNTDAETDFAAQVARELVGDAHVVEQADLLMGSEDFAFMLQQRPGSFVRLGNGEGEDGCMVHNPKYDFNDRNLPIGAAFWTRLVERYLAQ
ncbi:M20 aminoacylase family protein [Burkholderia vietnamiensis]|uniref:Amidohydrolase n=1 Tax=Burkholderia vietnamiensis TaxID=60552 RepID=A0A132E477_BURVI|nr:MULTISPECIES: M20 aminoacylase family protein [Burkholderia]AFJ87588.1 Catalyzes the cleavage of p-aminobenzoyl-glutamate to p-aminobenzoate and glutamate, subunit A [Burkholderia sp. KJ006]AJY03175.1 amidohydrolase family protein [Burkholderia vietnamiensis LMG 10929]AOJ99277.1 amidohydrolase [Burkholderia vietnamiensis]AOK11835.1 amidohydrolase [Burkholderia vietnamiensis]AOK44128.1 amidohydrolase [Burkholderia vietnamiensis]